MKPLHVKLALSGVLVLVLTYRSKSLAFLLSSMITIGVLAGCHTET